jgi:hypothetical protein
MVLYKKTHKPTFEPDIVPVTCGMIGSRSIGPEHPESNRYRGRLLKLDLEHVEGLLGRQVKEDIVLYFFPDVVDRLGVQTLWIDRKLAGIRSGKGCTQGVFARLVPIFWRLPHCGWGMGMPLPPSTFATYAFPDGIRRGDGSHLKWPLGTGPESAAWALAAKQNKQASYERWLRWREQQVDRGAQPRLAGQTDGGVA